MKTTAELEYIFLVQSNGHSFENSDTPEWLQFWKSPERKVYTIPNTPAPESGNTELLEQMGAENYQIYQHFFL